MSGVRSLVSLSSAIARPYRLEQFGEGAMGIVFEATHEPDNEVVRKICDGSETRLSAALRARGPDCGRLSTSTSSLWMR